MFAMETESLRLSISHTTGHRDVALPASGTLTLGRSSACDICLDDTLISRKHVAFHIDARSKALLVEDLGSHNGTQLIRSQLADQTMSTGGTQKDDLPARTKVPITFGDVVLVGRALILLGSAITKPTLSDDEAIIVDPVMTRLAELVERIAPSNVSVILLGETGVGKEVFARRIHKRSMRSGPFLGLNCGAIPEALLESELFGHQKGAFTGATDSKAGLLESAGAGTVFLDEVGEVSLGLQVKLLRVLEERSIRRVGARSHTPIEARFLSATNRSLENEIAAGRFREDFYYRLNGVSLIIPPLRKRTCEVVPLAHRFLRQLSNKPARLTEAAESKLLAYSWPGNIRELRSVIELGLALSPSEVIDVEHLLLTRRISGEELSRSEMSQSEAVTPEPDAPASPLNEIRKQATDKERQTVIDALEQCAGNQTRAAAVLGISRRQLSRQLDKLNLPRPRKGKKPPKTQ